MKQKEIAKKILIAILVPFLVTILSMALNPVGMRTENILLLYTFGLLIIIMETRDYCVAVASSVVMMGAFNFFFTEPRYTFQVYNSNYFISFAVFLVISVIITSLVVRIQSQIKALEQTQRITSTLYMVSKGYLNVSGMKQIAKYGVEWLKSVEKREYIIFINDFNEYKRIPYGNEEEISEDLYKSSEWCFLQSTVCGRGTNDYSNLNYYMMPIVSKGMTYGVLAVNCRKGELTDDNLKVIEAIGSIIAMAMDREYSNMAERESRNISEREKLRNSLLRSISHDLRTPLQGIVGSTSFLLDSYEEIDKDSRDTLLKDIMNESVWLSRLADNLLNMTRIQEGKLDLKFEEEVIDDIVGEVRTRIKKRMGSRSFETVIPSSCMIVPMDGQLIIQVIVNLMDNAIKHTNEDGHIKLVVDIIEDKRGKKPGYARFSVVDDGDGIDEHVKCHMFDNFVTTDIKKEDSRRGTGLGLSIASEIIRMHRGKIGAFNNKNGGATVFFMIPLVRSEDGE